jgi:hypothetical protein
MISHGLGLFYGATSSKSLVRESDVGAVIDPFNWMDASSNTFCTDPASTCFAAHPTSVSKSLPVAYIEK